VYRWRPPEALPTRRLRGWAVHARSTTISAQRNAIDTGIAYVNDEVVPALMEVPGCVGLSLIVDRPTGHCIATSSWESADAMTASEAALGPVRAGAADAFGGTIDTVDEWEIAVLHREHRSGDSACVRCTWLQVPPDDIDRAVQLYNSRVLPEIEAMSGFRSASFFIDRASGRCVSASAWTTRDKLEHSQMRLDELRATASAEAGARVIEAADFDLVIAQLRAPERI